MLRCLLGVAPSGVHPKHTDWAASWQGGNMAKTCCFGGAG